MELRSENGPNAMSPTPSGAKAIADQVAARV
jgi:hypothetical protein